VHERTEKVLLKVKRAKHHIADLDARIHEFFTRKPHPYPIIREIDSETGDLVFKLGKCSPIPEDFPLIVGDAIQNLRASLDHLVSHLVRSNGCVPVTSTGFPFCKTSEKYKTEGPRKIDGIAPEAIPMFGALQPYPGGNDGLYGLHEMSNIDKHRLLVVCACMHVGTTVTMTLSPTPTEFKIALPAPMKWDYRLEDGAEIFRIFEDQITNFNQDPDFSFRIAYGETESPDVSRMLPPLHQLADFVGAIILQFDRFMK
jgi:hypothetical protein